MKEVLLILRCLYTDYHPYCLYLWLFILLSDQKVYFSLQNVSLTLKDTVHDIALATLSGFVMSAENRNGIKYQKLSAKAESFNLEAANMDQELVYVMKLVEPTPSAGQCSLKC